MQYTRWGALAMTDRRKHIRVKFRSALPGAIGRTTVFVTDASAGGLGIAHEGQLPPPGGICRVEVMSELGPIRLDCAIVRTVADAATNIGAALFHTGLEVIASDRQSAARLQSIAVKG